jgi:DNA polymerase III delta prime subunit
MNEEFLWCEKYRPQTVNDTILPERYKDMFNSMVTKGEIPNLILTGSSGIGKTTIARAMCDELDCSTMIINSSLDGGKDTLRNQIKEFASTVSLRGGRKIVILDEADGLTYQMQEGLKAFMEEFSSNCGFILTCNLTHRIIPAIQSRCALVEFRFSREEKLALLKLAIKRIVGMLKKEEIEFDVKAVAAMVQKKYPDIRKAINELQKYSHSGKIDSGILSTMDDKTFANLVTIMKSKSFDNLRNWVANCDMDQHEIYTNFFDYAHTYWSPNCAVQVILTLRDYQTTAVTAVNPDINLMACLLEISSMDWKD